MFERKNSSGPIPRQWLLAAVAVGVVLLASMYYIDLRLRREARASALETLRSVASLKTQEIHYWLEDRLAFLGEPGGGWVAHHFSRLLQLRDTAAAVHTLETRFSYLQQTVPELRSVWLYDRSGSPRLGSRGTRPHAHPADDDLPDAVMTSGKPRLRDIHAVAGQPDTVALEILVPLMEDEGQGAQVIGYAVFELDPRAKLFPLIQTWPVPSKTAESMLSRREGDQIVYLNSLRHKPSPPLGLRLPLTQPGLIAGQFMLTRQEIFDGVDYRGEPALGASLAVPGTEWVLTAKMDESEVYAESRRISTWIAGGGLVCFLFLLALGRGYVATQQARMQEARYRMLAEGGSDVVWLYELAAQRFTYVSPSIEKMCGYTVAQVHQQTLEGIMTADSRQTLSRQLPEWLAAVARGDEGARHWRFELVMLHKDGSEVITETVLAPIMDAQRQVTHVQGVSRNITEQRRIERAQAGSEAKFRTIYDAINDAIFIHEARTGRIVDVNLTAERMYGYRREQLLTLDLVELSAGVAPYGDADALAHLQLAQEKGWDAFEWRARDKDGRLFWCAVNLQPLTLDGEPCVLAVVRDIEGRKLAEDGLRRALDEANRLNARLADAQGQLLQSEKLASIGQLAAGVAHELNNPIGFVSSNLGTLENYLQDILSIIAAYERAEQELCGDCEHLAPIQTLKEEKDFAFLKTDIHQLMAESKEGLARVAKIVRDLKDFSRVGESDAQWADLHQGLESTLNIAWNEIKYKCTVKKEYGELPPVWCVPSQINQVFMNLLVNAAHAIPETGEITIRTGQVDGEVFVAIADTGRGIPPEHLTRIFDPFFTTKPVGQGTGLGLSLAYGIVKKHQGRIEVDSEVGRGTVFTLWLPIEAKLEDAALRV